MHNYLKITLLTVLVAILLSCTNDPPDIIPFPASIKMKSCHFLLNGKTTISFQQQELKLPARDAALEWKKKTGYELEIQQTQTGLVKNNISLLLNQNYDTVLGYEGYRLSISRKGIEVKANSSAGIRYGLETIGQMMTDGKKIFVPCAEIVDFPRFSYRGMHLDVSRHFMPIETIYKMIDLLVMHKMNVFHWHLVDDQGWRLEIKKYPRLTEVGAWRDLMPDIHWNDRPFTTDRSKANYGGFYTREEVKRIVAYAAERNVTIIPEIEMPAHVMSALAAYPELSCTGQNPGIPSGGVWPITHIYCAGKEETFHFLENVLTEVMEMFPSTYIHIGGDEADKTNWKTCPYCRKRIETEGLKNEEELQSYFISRIERFLNAHGRKIIGWDEILEGGLAPNATVMSWRGEKGGIEAVKMGHHVVMTPGSHCYFDHYQGNPATEPEANGGYTTLKMVYGYEPVPVELTVEEGQLVLGAQANVWTEFIADSNHLEYMILPRLSALAEVLWSPKEIRDWGFFSRRMVRQYQRYEEQGLNYALSAYQVTSHPSVDFSTKSMNFELSSEAFEPMIRYTLDGSIPTSGSPVYTGPITIKEPSILKAVVFKDGISTKQVYSELFDIHLAFASPVQLKYPASQRYDGGGDYGLVDGIKGTVSFTDGRWKGWSGSDLVAVIDLSKPTEIKTIELHSMQAESSWIFLPKWVRFELSDDNITFQEIATVIDPADTDNNTLKVYSCGEVNNRASYLRVTAKNYGICPAGHPGEGQPAWLFVSEIMVK
ncbi:MAG TPA: family 20 glycosylhydrolase [Bacteroidales bacterium]|nr:family 20 glycosylhydrolase [Bacteroidales bacterium]